MDETPAAPKVPVGKISSFEAGPEVPIPTPPVVSRCKTLVKVLTLSEV